MNRRNFTLLMLLVWLAVFVWSIVFTQITPPSGDGFTRGLNRITGFMGWQVMAVLLAIITWRAGAVLAKGSVLRKVSLGPILVETAVIALIFLVIAWKMVNQPEPGIPPQLTPTEITD